MELLLIIIALISFFCGVLFMMAKQSGNILYLLQFSFCFVAVLALVEFNILKELSYESAKMDVVRDLGMEYFCFQKNMSETVRAYYCAQPIIINNNRTEACHDFYEKCINNFTPSYFG